MPTLPQIKDCFGCATCVDSCAQQAIQLVENTNGFYVPHINEALCVDCGLCEQHCPSLQESSLSRHPLVEEQLFAAWSSDEDIIARSASGGVFGQVAKEFLKQGNSIVYGARLTLDSKVEHIGIERVEDLHWLQNSKYQQSNTSGIYKDVRTNLKAGKNVLFSGTPCQVAGLYCFLRNEEYPNLYTAEVVCHGVPTNYLAPLALKVENAQQIIQYRTKSQGWERGNRTVYKTVDGTQEECPRYRLDFHFRAYLSFCWLRKSCNHCPFAQIDRIADITMGDFWGSGAKKHIHPQGVSLLIVNSKRGRALIQRTKEMVFEMADWEDVAPNQNCYMPTVQGSKYAHLIHHIKSLPLWIQKIIFQRGFSNKWLFGLGQVMQKIISYPKQIILDKKKKRIMSHILNTAASSKKRVGILTTYFAANFGAMLQPFAMRRVLEKMGFNVEFIKYKQKAVYSGHRAWSWSRIFGNGIGSAIGNLLALPFAICQDKKMQQFKRSYLKVGDDFDVDIPKNLDYYIFGSDQIWNPQNTNGFDDVYFGGFDVNVGVKKIAYAASGEKIDNTLENILYLKNHLHNFDAIAVRETSLKEKLSNMTGIQNIEVVVDPTLLATKDIIDELPGNNIMGNDKYVLFYHLRQSVGYIHKIHDYARQHGWKLLIISSSPKKDYIFYASKHKDVKYLPCAGMEDFLGGIRGAECVFTPSFHGNVFALIYHKPLFSISLGDGLDTRSHDLLRLLGIDNRIITMDSDLNDISAIDFSNVENQIQQLREHSMEYLQNNIKP